METETKNIAEMLGPYHLLWCGIFIVLIAGGTAFAVRNRNRLGVNTWIPVFVICVVIFLWGQIAGAFAGSVFHSTMSLGGGDPGFYQSGLAEIEGIKMAYSLLSFVAAMISLILLFAF